MWSSSKVYIPEYPKQEEEHKESDVSFIVLVLSFREYGRQGPHADPMDVSLHKDSG